MKARKTGDNGTREKGGRNMWEQRGWAHRVCRMVPALLLESPSYPLHLMEPVQDSLIHLQGGRRSGNVLDGSGIAILGSQSFWEV